MWKSRGLKPAGVVFQVDLVGVWWMRVLLVHDGTLTMDAILRLVPEALKGYPVEVVVRELAGTGTARITSCLPGGRVAEFYGSPEEMSRLVEDAEVLVVHKAPVTEEVIASTPSLRLIICARGHPVNVDLQAAAARGVRTVHLPGRAAGATADLTMGLILMLARNLFRAVQEVREKGTDAWSYCLRTELEGVELDGKVLGLIGFGEVGRQVARRALSFGMKVLVYSPSVAEEVIESSGALPVELEELLKRSDFVSLHTRLTPDKKNLINRERLRTMKPTACLINTARGGLVDEGALYEAVREGWIRAAALDVLLEEPPEPGHPLLSLPGVIITPHVGGKTRDMVERAARLTVEKLIAFLEGRLFA